MCGEEALEPEMGSTEPRGLPVVLGTKQGARAADILPGHSAGERSLRAVVRDETDGAGRICGRNRNVHGVKKQLERERIKLCQYL